MSALYVKVCPLVLTIFSDPRSSWWRHAASVKQITGPNPNTRRWWRSALTNALQSKTHREKGKSMKSRRDSYSIIDVYLYPLWSPPPNSYHPSLDCITPPQQHRFFFLTKTWLILKCPDEHRLYSEGGFNLSGLWWNGGLGNINPLRKKIEKNSVGSEIKYYCTNEVAMKYVVCPTNICWLLLYCSVLCVLPQFPSDAFLNISVNI